MSIRASAWAWTVETEPTAKFVLVALADFADETGLCWPSVSTLVQRTRLAERTIQNAMRGLETNGLVVTERRDGKPTRYRLQIGAQPPQQMHPREECTPAADAEDPRSRCTPPPQDVHPTPAADAPEPSITVSEPPLNRQSAPRARRLPEEWWPSSGDQAFARDLGLDPTRIADSFRDYWHGKAGASATKTDWSATWRNWCRRDAERKPAHAPKPSKLAWMMPR